MLALSDNRSMTTPQFSEGLYSRFVQYLDVKPRTIDTYKKALRQLFAYFGGHGIANPRREDITAYRDALRGSHKATTVQTYMTATRLFFRWTAQEGLYPNIAENIKGATVSKEHKKDYLAPSQVKAVLEGIERGGLQGLRDYAIIALMTTGGLRDIEVSRANREDLRAAGSATVLYVQGKGREDKGEYIKVEPQVEKAIRAYLKRTGAADGTQPLFTSTSNNSQGERLSTRSISAIVKGRLQGAGYDSDRLTAHSLRHTAVTLSLLGGNTLQETQQFARHSNITTTQIYAHNLDRANNRCAATIARAIF